MKMSALFNLSHCFSFFGNHKIIFVTVWNTYLYENKCFFFKQAYIFSGHVSYTSCLLIIITIIIIVATIINIIANSFLSLYDKCCYHRCNYHQHHCHHCQQFLSAQDNCCPCAIWSKNCGKYIQLNTPPSIHNSDEDEEVDFIPVLFWGLWLPCLS